MLSEWYRKFLRRSPAPVSVLVVCMENICRSPMAEGALKQAFSKRGLTGLVKVESAGTLASQPGSRPDVRAVKVAQLRGINIGGIRSRIIKTDDYYNYNYILAIDNDVLLTLNKKKAENASCEIIPLMSFVKKTDMSEVPDPYYGNRAGFDHVMDLVELAAEDIAVYLVNNDLKDICGDTA